MSEYIKYLFVRTPLEEIFVALQNFVQLKGAILHPELFDVAREGARLRTAIRRLIQRPDANTVDVGAHIGSILSLLTKLAPEGQHWAFEPMADKADWLRKKFPDVDIRATALGEKPGKVTFHINTSQTGYSGMFPHGLDGHEYIQSEVEVERLDDVIPEDCRIDFLKVIVEGAELSVLRGSTRILAESHPVLMMESSASALEAWNLNPEVVFGFLDDHDYDLYTPVGFLRGKSPLTLMAYQQAISYPFKAFFFIALPR